jgi:hypothetical protein
MTNARQEKPSQPTPSAAEVYAHHVKHEMSKATRVAVERYVDALAAKYEREREQLRAERDGALEKCDFFDLCGNYLPERTMMYVGTIGVGNDDHSRCWSCHEHTDDPEHNPDCSLPDPLDAALALIALGWELGAYPGAPPDVWHNDGAVVAPCGGRWDFSDGANITAGGHYGSAMEAAVACMGARGEATEARRVDGERARDYLWLLRELARCTGLDENVPPARTIREVRRLRAVATHYGVDTPIGDSEGALSDALADRKQPAEPAPASVEAASLPDGLPLLRAAVMRLDFARGLEENSRRLNSELFEVSWTLHDLLGDHEDDTAPELRKRGVLPAGPGDGDVYGLGAMGFVGRPLSQWVHESGAYVVRVQLLNGIVWFWHHDSLFNGYTGGDNPREAARLALGGTAASAEPVAGVDYDWERIERCAGSGYNGAAIANALREYDRQRLAQLEAAAGKKAGA